MRNIVFLLIFLFLVGCRSETVSKTDVPVEEGSRSLNVIATTGQINSALQKLTEGTGMGIKLFCGPGVDPHAFKASTRDIQAMQDADAIFYNGFHLEAKLADQLNDTFESKSWSMASAFPDEYRLQWEEDGEVDPEAPFDPHIWNHLPGWSSCVQGLADQLIALDPSNGPTYQKNCDAYVGEIMNLHEWSKSQINEIPEGRRYLVSAHDAFNYFAEVYDMRTMAVLGVGNDPEADIKTMRQVAEEVCEHKVPVIFLETITNPKVTQALQEACQARDWDVQIASRSLYSDDLGETAPQDTFLGAFKSNVELISASLK
ncbi:MAG: zinc ABC transporter substrate-binding protein [Mariniblastus sp.]|nr:zinc ABC transporter substrate-binding protein [Mariniblastus sp.]